MAPCPSFDQTWQPIGGRVALITPVSTIATDVLGVTLRQLEVHGMDYHLGRHAETRYRCLAGTVEQCLEDLYNTFDMLDIATVWCLRDGYGCGQLLSGLDWGRLQAVSPWPLIGFPDISMLLSTFHRHGLSAIHGPTATELGLLPLNAPREQQEQLASLTSVGRLLAGIDHELPVQHLGEHRQHVEGALIGGNLAALACMAGTLDDLRVPAGLIPVPGDVGEPYYHLERSLWQLFESIDARQLGMIYLGSFVDCSHEGVVHSLEWISGEYTAAIEVPLYHRLPSGYGVQDRAQPCKKTTVLEGNRLR